MKRYLQKHTDGKQFSNIDEATVDGFGDEWSRFTQEKLDEGTRKKIFLDYFSQFPWNALPDMAVGADIGCGSGRWALVVAPLVGELHLVDASQDALSIAKENLNDIGNVKFQNASVDCLPFEDDSLDFAYSLGVLHHVPDTAGAIKSISRKLKKGSPLLLYLYYAFDNRGYAYHAIWKLSELVRKVVSRMPYYLRYPTSQLIALFIYFPLARFALLLDKFHVLPSGWPLSYYRDKPFYVLRTDALDRFGTRLEQRFTREEIKTMLEQAGIDNIRFSDQAPYWCVIGNKV